MKSAIFAFEDDRRPAAELARELDIPWHPVMRHRFPDGESLVRVDWTADRPILFRRLDRPNGKLFDLLLAADAFAGQGCAPPVLVTPYLPYMRQDAAFRRGEAVSQRVLGRLLDGPFSALLTVDPHLHRTPSLHRLLPRTRTLRLSAAPLLAGMISSDQSDALLLGPDVESAPLVRAVAHRTGCAWRTLVKERRDDRTVRFLPATPADFAGRPVILIDDCCSSGATLAGAARLALAAGAASVEALVVHALHDERATERLGAAGLARLRSVDSVPHPSNAAALAPLLAEALREFAS